MFHLSTANYVCHNLKSLSSASIETSILEYCWGRNLIHITTQNVLRLWWKHGTIRSVVIALTGLAVLDSIYTAMWIGQRGLAGELNPLIRAIFEMGLGGVWWVTNIVITLVAAAFLGSCIAIFPAPMRLYPVLGMSLLATLRVLLALYHLIQFYGLMELTWVVWLGSIGTFLLTRAALTKESIFDWKSIALTIREMRSDRSTSAIVSRTAKPSSKEIAVQPSRMVQPRAGGTLAALRNWRLVFWIIVVILTPLLALSVIELTLGASGVLNLPPWMRELGIVSEEQGKLALVAFATIFLAIGVLVYGVVAAFEALSGEGERKRKRRS